MTELFFRGVSDNDSYKCLLHLTGAHWTVTMTITCDSHSHSPVCTREVQEALVTVVVTDTAEKQLCHSHSHPTGKGVGQLDLGGARREHQDRMAAAGGSLFGFNWLSACLVRDTWRTLVG